MTRLAPLLLALALAAPAPARTTEAAPVGLDRDAFEAEASAAAPNAGTSYPYIRCVGLFRALRLYADRGAVPVEGLRVPTDAETLLTQEAIRTRIASGTDTGATAGLQAERDIDAVADLYTREFDAIGRLDVAGPERGDSPRWWNDAVIETDLRACGVLVEAVGAAQP